MSYKKNPLFDAINTVTQGRIDNRQIGDWYFRPTVQDHIWRGGVPKPLYEEQKAIRKQEAMEKYPTSYTDSGEYIEPKDRVDYVPYPKAGQVPDKYKDANKELEELINKARTKPSKSSGYFTGYTGDGNVLSQFGKDLYSLPKKLIVGSEGSRSGLQRFGDALTVPLSAVVNPLIKMVEGSNKYESEWGGLKNADDIGQLITESTRDATDLLTGNFMAPLNRQVGRDEHDPTLAKELVRESAKSLKGLNVFAREMDRENLQTTTNLLDSLGWKAKEGAQLTKPSTWSLNNMVRAGASFAGDVVLDPTSYINYGLTTLTSDVARGTGSKVGRRTIEPMTEEMARQSLERAGSEVTSDAVQSIIQEVNKKQGLRASRQVMTKKPFASRVTDGNVLFDSRAVQEFGDRTIAPKVNAVIEAITNPKRAFFPDSPNLIEQGSKIALRKKLPKIRLDKEVQTTLSKNMADDFNFTKKEVDQIFEAVTNPQRVVHREGVLRTPEGQRAVEYIDDIFDRLERGDISVSDLKKGIDYDAVSNVERISRKFDEGVQQSMFDVKPRQSESVKRINDLYDEQYLARQTDRELGRLGQKVGSELEGNQLNMLLEGKFDDVKNLSTTNLGRKLPKVERNNVGEFIEGLDRGVIGKELKELTPNQQIKYLNEHVFLDKVVHPNTSKYNLDVLIDSIANDGLPNEKALDYMFNAPERFDGSYQAVDAFLTEHFGDKFHLDLAERKYMKGETYLQSNLEKALGRKQVLKKIRNLDSDTRINFLREYEKGKLDLDVSEALDKYLHSDYVKKDMQKADLFIKSDEGVRRTMDRANAKVNPYAERQQLEGGFSHWYGRDRTGKAVKDRVVQDKQLNMFSDMNLEVAKPKPQGPSIEYKLNNAYHSLTDSKPPVVDLESKDFIESDFGQEYIRTKELLDERYNENSVYQTIRKNIAELFDGNEQPSRELIEEIRNDAMEFEFYENVVDTALGKDYIQNMLLKRNPLYDQNGNKIPNRIAKFSDDLINEFRKTSKIKQDLGKTSKTNWFRDGITPLLTADGRNLIHSKDIDVRDVVEDMGIFLENPADLFDNYTNQRITNSLDKINKTMFDKYGIKKFVNDDIGDIYVNHMASRNKMMYQSESVSDIIKNFGRKVFDNDKYHPLQIDETAFVKSEDVYSIIGGMDKVNEKKFLKELGMNNVLKDGYAMPMIEVDEKSISRITELLGPNKVNIIDKDVFRIARNAGLSQQKRDTGVFLDLFDKVTRWWKVNATSAMPGFHARNKVGNMFQGYINVGSEAIKPQNMKEARKVLDGAKGFIETPDGKFDYSYVRDAMESYGLLDGGFYRNTLGTDSGKVSRTLSDKVNRIVNIFDVDNHFYYDMMSSVGSKVESGDRAVNFIAGLKKGLSFEESAEMVNRHLFDYGDLSNFERNFMRRIIPFYTWSSKNIPLQYETLRDMPNFHKNIYKALNAVGDQIPESERVDREYINDFAKDWVQLPGTVTNPDGIEEPIMFNPNLPYSDLDHLFGLLNPSSTSREIKSRVNPLLKIPYELATNRQLYFDQPIKADDYDNSKRQHGLVQLSKDFINMAQGKPTEEERIDPYLRYMHDQVPSWKNVGGFLEKEGSDRFMHGLNHLGGIKLMSYNTDRVKYFQMRDTLEKLRKEEERNKKNNKR